MEIYNLNRVIDLEINKRRGEIKALEEKINEIKINIRVLGVTQQKMNHLNKQLNK